MDGPPDPETEAILEASRYWVQTILVPITVVIGVAGNTVTVMVLTRHLVNITSIPNVRPLENFKEYFDRMMCCVTEGEKKMRRRMRSTTNVYLSALAIADIIHLFCTFLLSFKHHPNINDGKYELYWRFLGLTYWFCDAASSTSVWLTVSFTVERYIAVCHPMWGRIFCTERRAKSVIVIVYIFCMLTTASTTFEHQLNLNETCIKECDIKMPQSSHHSINGTVNHYVPNHTMSYNTKFTIGSIASHPNLDENYFTQLRQIILSNCTAQPCIIYVPHFPSALNVSKDKALHPNIIEKVLKPGGPEVMSHIREISLEPVLEKPPSEADIVNNSTDLDSNNKTDSMESNGTCCVKQYRITEESTKLGKNKTYTTIMYWYSSLVFWLIPLTLIATFNLFLIRAVYLSQRMRRQMTNSQESVGSSNEKRITVMLIGVIILFIVCHTPTGLILIYNNFHKSETAREENIIKILGNFFNYFMIVSAACNFMLYCFFSKKFRTTFRKIFFERRKKKQDMIMLSSTKSKSSQKFNPYKHGIMKRRNASEYQTPRNLETQSLTSIPRSKSLIIRPVGKAKSSDLII